MKATGTALPGLIVIEQKVFKDDRGFFMETYNEAQFEKLGLSYHFVQDNHSYSREAGTIRGLHYQLAPKAQSKLVRVLKGAIYDVAVDLRHDSPTYKQWYGIILTDHNACQLLIPKGFAHGFCTLVPDTEVAYKVDALYSSKHDRGIVWNDPELAIDWPESDVTLSAKDQRHPCLRDAEFRFRL